jgi:hypothetical protein
MAAVQSLQCCAAEGHLSALRLKSPGSGLHSINFQHGMKPYGAAEGSIYIIEASVIDDALGENATSYAEAIAADPYQGGASERFDAYKNIINAQIANSTPVLTTSYYTDEKYAIGESISETPFFFSDGKEYVVVFTADKKHPSVKTSAAYIFMGALTLVPADSINVDVLYADNNYISKDTDGRSSITFQVPVGCGRLALYLKQTTRVVSTIDYFKSLKIEHGNVSTSWSPAPADRSETIISNGKTGVWYWEKWSSGKAVCWGSVNATPWFDWSNPSMSAGRNYYLPPLSYPFIFKTAPHVFLSSDDENVVSINQQKAVQHNSALDNLRVLYQGRLPEGTTTLPINMYVVGRWK